MVRNLETKGLIRYRLFLYILILGVYGWEYLNNFNIRKEITQVIKHAGCLPILLDNLG